MNRKLKKNLIESGVIYMPEKVASMIENLVEDVEILLNYIKFAEDKGIDFPNGLELDLVTINTDLENVYDLM